VSGFAVKDSGARQEFASGMVRDTSAGKPDYTRVLDGPMLDRWAEHLAKGAIKYPDIAPGVANWTLAEGPAELARFRASAFRHFVQWMRGEADEDHAAAVFFNLNGAEYVKARMFKEKPKSFDMPEPIKDPDVLAEIPHGEGFGVVRTVGKMGAR
jgi:hypothetical protein